MLTFARRGLSTQVLYLLAAFLKDRTISVRLEGIASEPRKGNTGALQGSVLGCYLFNIGVDDLEENMEPVNEMQAEVHEETHSQTDDYPAESTPSRVYRRPERLAESPIVSRTGCDFRILPRVANVPPWIPKPKDPIFKPGDIKSYKFVDDNVYTSKVNMRQATMLTEGDVNFKEIVDKRTEALLEHVSAKALNKGMLINAAKTSLMCVSAATSFKAKVRVTLEGESVTSADKLKILGVTLNSDVSFRSHVEKIASKCRAKS